MADGGPSLTARWVAAHRLDYDRLPAPYGDPAADDALGTEVSAGLDAPYDTMHDYLAIRTRFFDQVVVRGIDRGIRQIVVGGAGYDGRALRYAAPGVRWFEVDQPSTQQDKVATLRRLGLASGHIRFVAADFTHGTAVAQLGEAGLDAGEPSLFLLEGVAVYLDAAELEALLGQFRDVAGRGSRLAISVPVTGAQRGRSRFRDAVAAMGEPARSRFEPAEAADLLARAGWHVRRGASGGASPDDDEGARRERLRGAGLLVARAGPRTRPPTTPGRAKTLRSLASPAFAPVSAERLPLSALLSHAFVAFTIEADNEAEHRMPHWTTDYGAGALGAGPWLVSLAMYENCLRYLAGADADGDGITVGELRGLARTGTNLDGMRRWGYITLTTADGQHRKPGPRLKPGQRRKPGQDAIIRATASGQLARQVWAPLPALIEDRWRDRFGTAAVGRLRDALQSVTRRLDPALPDCLPILGFGLFARPSDPPPPPSPQSPGQLPLHALLARSLRSIALDFERESELSLALSANVLRVLTEQGVRLKDLPRLTGVSKEAISMALTALKPAGLASTEKEPGGHWQIVRLTAQGQYAQRVHREHLTACEESWRARHDPAAIGALRDVLEPLAATDAVEPAPLFAGLRPYPDGWRAAVRPAATLPHYPMVLHRGGYPDGS